MSSKLSCIDVCNKANQKYVNDIYLGGHATIRLMKQLSDEPIPDCTDKF